MDAKDLAHIGFCLGGDVERHANDIFWKDDNHYYELERAEEIRRKATHIEETFSNPDILEKMRGCELLQRARKLPDEVPADDELRYFEQLRELYEGFLAQPESWEVYLSLNRQRIVELWEEPERWERQFQERDRLTKERQEREFQENLARAREQFSHPQQEAPCFPTTRKNGLNCNRNTLVEIRKLPEIPMEGRKVEVFIHRCSACWQIYKEVRETSESPRHFRDHFLKAGESDAATGLGFSADEETEFGKIDFASIVCPILRNAGNDATA